ncbi:MAG: site-specific DNA-methyltransferase [Candidatus Marinimicrobia bacterium]|nr:site-specific DNA-methyltransferase [Candidatus Neomarinimicrobiota bacterium]MBL7109398.1 site-specific DNA-methyltransferase [Candidatus Neomarinimicrobiota bacterium]
MATNTKKDKFYSVLKNIFIGAKIEGNSGYVNLMRIKNKYYQDFKGQLATDIDKKLDEVGRNFEEELYNKLYTFFKKYFSESGSIYFSYTPLQEKVYERIYRDDKDVMLFWKTNMLYYVKTERLYQNMDFQDEDNQIWYHFDVLELEHKKNNEKKELIFEYDKSHFEDNKREIFFKVKYSKNGSKTKIDDILKKVKRSVRALSSYKEAELKRALGIFLKQSEVDYFINKNAQEFLQEQFSLWVKTYIFDDDTVFEEARLKQLKALRDIAYNIIDLVSQFEDELVKIWNKPKFAHSSNYVITLDKIAEKDFVLLEKLLKHKAIADQVKEWQKLGMCKDKFNVADIFKKEEKEKELFEKGNQSKLNQKLQFLPLDTKYFKDLEFDILALFNDLDNQLDGWLIHSENYQALNTIKHKYYNQVQTIFIDPPFNLDKNADFSYLVNYKDSTWLSLLENRLPISKHILKNNGNFFGRCDENGNNYFKSALNKVFGASNYRNEIKINRFQKSSKGLTNTTESLFLFANSENSEISPITKQRQCIYCKSEVESKWQWSHSAGASDIAKEFLIDEKWTLLHPPKGRHWTNSQEKIIELTKQGQMRINNTISYTDCNGEKFNFCPERLQDPDVYIDDNWTDIPGYEFGVYTFQNFSTQNSEVLLKRVIQLSTGEGDLCLDYFAGSATTQAVSHKLKRRWIGVEMGDHFYNIDVPRMKMVIGGDKKYISKDEDVNWKGGGFFKYYELEQYEEALRSAKYEDKGALPKDIYHQYLFFKDLKLADEVIKLDDESKSIKVDLTKLHDKIDIPETLSFLTGKFIKQILKDKVVFTDGSEIEYANIDYKIVKPLIWW